MAEEITYDQIDTDGTGPGDPLGLRKKLQSGGATTKASGDILGLRAQLNAIKQPAPQPKQPAFQPATDWLNIQQPSYTPIAAGNVVNEHTIKTGQASERVKEHLLDIDNSVRNLIHDRKKDLEGRMIGEQLGLNPKELGPANSQAQELSSMLRQDVPVNQKEIDDFKNAMGSNQLLMRQGLAQKAKDLEKSDPVKAKQLKSDIYRLDRQNNPEKDAKIEDNIKKINEGDYDYDISNGVLTKPVGFFTGIIEGFKQKNQAFNDYEVYSSGKEDEIIKHLNKKINGDPDDPMVVGTGGFADVIPGGEAGMAVGGQPLKPLAGGALAGWIGGPQAGAASAALISGPEMYKLGYANALPQNYAEIKKQNPSISDQEAYHRANELSDKQASVDAATGIAMGALGGEFAFKPTGLGVNLLRKSVGSALKQIGEDGAKKALEGLGVGAVGGAGQIVKNLISQQAGLKTETSSGVVDQLKMGASMTLGMTIAAKFPNLLKPKTYNQLLQSLKSVPTDEMIAYVNSLEKSGALSPGEGQSLQKSINDHRVLDNSIKSDVPESDRIVVQELIKKRNELEAGLEVEDKAYHADTKEKIKALNEQINNISKGNERDELQKLIDKEHKDGNLQGYVTETLRNASEGDLKKYFKEISEQAHDPNSEQATIATFGENIVNKAKELFPKAEAKESKISVIQPGKIQRPEVRTIAPKEHPMSGEAGAGKVPVEQLGHVEVSEHGEDAKTAAGKENGIGPSPLTKDGMREAKELGQYIADNNKSKIITSEVERGLQTAEEAAKEAKRITGKEVPIERNELLNTANIGSDEGKPEGTFKEKEWFEGKYMPDGAESPESFKARMEKAYQYVKSLPEDTHVVSHSKVMRALDALAKTDGKWTEETTNIFLQNKELTHAVPVESANEMDVRQQTTDGQGVGTGNAQPESAPGKEIGGEPKKEGKDTGKEGIGKPPVGASEGKGIYVEHPETQLSFRGLQETANEFGFEDVKSRDRVSDLQERKNAENEVNEWVAKGEYQKNIDHLLTEIENRRLVPVARQRLILEQYLANEKHKARMMNKLSPEYDTQVAKIQYIKNVGTIARQEAGAALRLPDSGTLPHPILDESDAMIAKMKANAVDKLTDQQKAEVESQVEKYRQANEDANKKIADLEAQMARLDAQKELDKAKSTAKRASKKTASERLAFRRSEIEAAREALRKLRSGESGLSAVPLPGVRELMTIAPHVKNIMVDLVAQGVDNLQDVISHLHAEFKDVLEGLTEKNIHDIIAGEYNEKGKSLSELQRQIKDLRDEAKYINQLESLLNGKEPKAEKAKIERNQKIKDLKEKIKSFKQEIKESEKFYGESNSGEEKLDKLRDELDRIKDRRKKESPAKGSAVDKEISQREQDLRDAIKEAQGEWDKEKEAAKQRDRDYARMESERNRQLQRVSDLKQKLENLQKGIKAKGKDAVKKADTPEIEALKRQVSDAEKELNKTIATEKRVKELKDELDRLKQRKEKEPKEINKREISDKEVELKKQIDEERKAFNKEKSEASKFYKEELDDDAKKLIAIKKRNQKLEQQIKERIANGQFGKEAKTSIFDREDVKKNYPRLRKDALDAIAQKEEAQHEFDLALFNDEMKRRKWYQKAVGFGGKLIHTSKAIMSGIDDSATFVQNGLAMLANPKLGAKAWWDHAKDAFSNERFKRELAAIHQRPDWEIIKKSGLEIVEPHSIASKQVEEAFEQNLLANLEIKGVKPWDYTGGVFERAFTSMGNNMRLLLFEKRMNALAEEGMTFESHPQEYKSAARVINELTGRGKLPAGLAQASPYITPFIWAPRMLASTLNILGLGEIRGLGGKGYYQNLTPMQRRFALGQLGRGVGIGIAVMGAAALGGARVDYDPRSVTFGDIIWGNHHYNIFGRFTPVVKVLVQAGMGVRVKGSGVQQDLDSGKFGAKTRSDIVAGFFRGKTTPAVSTALNLMEGRNYFTNEKFTLKDVPGALLQPMSIKELRDGWNNDGSMTILNRFLPAFEGMKTSDERDFNKKGGSGGGAGATGTISHKTVKHKTSHSIHKTR